jgi:hypothetical protein
LNIKLLAKHLDVLHVAVRLLATQMEIAVGGDAIIAETIENCEECD